MTVETPNGPATLTLDPTRSLVPVAGDRHDLETLQALVGGLITVGVSIPSTDGGEVVVFCDDEGLLKPIQSLTGIFVGTEFHNLIAGPLVFTGGDDEGETRNLTQREADAIRSCLSPGRLVNVRGHVVQTKAILTFPAVRTL
jgi:hypothetical protein